MPDPTRHTTTAQFLWNLKEFKGDKWLDLVKALANQRPLLVESLAPVTTTIIKGEAPVGITYIKYVKQYKGPVDYVLMDKYLTDPNYMSLSAKAANPNAAKLYIEFIMLGGRPKTGGRGRGVRAVSRSVATDQETRKRSLPI